jgi:hypothetical protein
LFGLPGLRRHLLVGRAVTFVGGLIPGIGEVVALVGGPHPGVVHGKADDPLTLASWTTSWARSATLRQGCLGSSRLR